jgi:hypothetical protein
MKEKKKKGKEKKRMERPRSPSCVQPIHPLRKMVVMTQHLTNASIYNPTTTFEIETHFVACQQAPPSRDVPTPQDIGPGGPGGGGPCGMA